MNSDFTSINCEVLEETLQSKKTVKKHHITDMNHPDLLCKNHLDRVEPHKLWRERDETHKL